MSPSKRLTLFVKKNPTPDSVMGASISRTFNPHPFTERQGMEGMICAWCSDEIKRGVRSRALSPLDHKPIKVLDVVVRRSDPDAMEWSKRALDQLLPYGVEMVRFKRKDKS